jgi:hypothetical protein
MGLAAVDLPLILRQNPKIQKYDFAIQHTSSLGTGRIGRRF